MGEAACTHETTYIGCEPCVQRYIAEREEEERAARMGSLTGIEKERLDRVRQKINVHLDGPYAFFGMLEKVYRGEVRADD